MKMMRSVLFGLLLLAVSAYAQQSTFRFPDLDHFPSAESEASVKLRAGLRYKHKAEKAHESGKLEAERSALDAARFNLKLSVDLQESMEARLSLGEVELRLGNPGEAVKSCRFARQRAVREEDVKRADACLSAAGVAENGNG